MLVVIMGMMIFSGLAYVSEKDEEGTMFISMPQVYTDKKVNQIFLTQKEIQNGAVAKSYMNNGFLMQWGNICAFPHILGSPSSYMTLQLLHSEFLYI